MKRSLARRLIRLFIFTLLITNVASVLVSFQNANHNELQRNSSIAHSAAKIAVEVLDQADLEKLADPENKELYSSTRKQMRAVCSNLSLIYLYIYTVDENNVRHYVMTVAGNEEADRLVEEQLGLGITSKEPLTEQEIDALKGEVRNDYYLLDNEYGKTAGWVTPYIDENGKTAALIGTDISLNVQNGEIVRNFLFMQIPVTVLLIIAFAWLYWTLKTGLLNPLHTVAEQMEHFDPDAEEEPLSIQSQDELQQIADAFTKMSGDIRMYIRNLTEITKEREYRLAQRDIARRIQLGMVPASFHQCENGVDIHALMDPAEEVGGDFYDCFELPDGRKCILAADVSGKSIAGALFMALAKNLVRTHIMSCTDPAEALNQVNDDLYLQNPEGLFVTLFALILDPLTGRAEYANAGHNPPVFLGNSGISYLKPKTGVALGLFPDSDVETETMTFSPGEGILLYTDGVTEAVSAERKLFGKDRLLELLQQKDDAKRNTLVTDIRKAVDEFSQGAGQADDITIVSLIYSKEDIKIPLELDDEGFAPIREKILSAAGNTSYGKKIILACEEAFVNIVNYSGATEADFSFTQKDDQIIVTLRDNGACFDPLSAVIKTDDEFLTMDHGGLGIRFMRSIPSDLSWTYNEGRNVLTLTFNLEENQNTGENHVRNK